MSWLLFLKSLQKRQKLKMLIAKLRHSPLVKPCCSFRGSKYIPARLATNKNRASSAVPLTETWTEAKEKTISSESEGKAPVKVEINDEAYNAIDLSFENGKEAFKSKTNFELIRSLFVFNLCSIPFFVNKNKEVSIWSQAVTWSWVTSRSHVQPLLS